VGLLKESRRGPHVDIPELLSASFVEYLGSLIQAGALVSIFRTRDGGALGVQVTFNGESEKEYFRTVEELESWLRELDDVVGEDPSPRPSATRGLRPA